MTTDEQQGGAVVAVGEARDALPAPDLSNLRGQTPATHTKAVGVIYPPPDIRAIVDKTATFVARNGNEFEKRILANEKQNQKFSFLVTTDPYHAYYQFKIKEIKEEDSRPAGAPAAASAASAAPAAPAKEDKPAVAPTKPLEAPAPELYMVHVPQGLTLLDLDIIKLTAQFVARNGKSFLTGLASREHANPQFNFLKPTHSMFTFFTSLADSYSKVLMPPKGTSEKLDTDAKDRSAILERCLKRLEWDRHKEAEAKAIADEEEAEKNAIASIDWHDFVVVETIEFEPAEDAELPPPMTLKEIIALSKSQPYNAEEEEAEGEMEMEMDEDEKEMVAAGAGVASAPPVSDSEEPIKIVKNYKRGLQNVSYDPTKFVVSPITGELVPLDQMAEHMRISLIDPRWKEQREAMLSKIRTTAKAGDDEISRNIMVLANTRPDIFGSTEEEMSAMVQETIREKRSTGNNADPSVGIPLSAGGPAQSTDPTPISMPRVSDPKPVASLPPPPSLPARPPANRPYYPPPPGMPLPPPPGFPYRPPGMPPPPGGSFPPRPGSLPPPPGGFPPPPMGMPPIPVGAPPVPLPVIPPIMPPKISAPEPEPVPEKRQRQDFVLKPESEVLADHPGLAKVMVSVPDVEGNDKLNGQVLEVEMSSLSDNVGDLKARLADVIGIGANKQKLTRDEVGVMRDNLSLAHYNVVGDVQLTLGLKGRGRGKK